MQPESTTISPVSKGFRADYNTTWKAVSLAMEKYPIAESDREKGFLKTAGIKGEGMWQLPFPTKIPPRLKYTLYIQLLKGKKNHQPITRVSILKQMTSQKGFIDSPRRIPSNGLEETNILYRTLREINIDRFIVNYNKKQAQKLKQQNTSP